MKENTTFTFANHISASPELCILKENKKHAKHDIILNYQYIRMVTCWFPLHGQISVREFVLQ